MLTAALNFLFPPQCLCCQEEVGVHGALCTTCWGRLSFLGEPACETCGYPFEFEILTHAQCGGCIKQSPPYAQARAVMRYDDHSQKLVTQMKYADQGQMAASYGKWLAHAGRSLIEQSDVIVPVPLHYLRLLQRRYNQSVLLGRALSRECGLAMIPDALLRTRYTRPQASLTHAQRQKNVRRAFAVSPRWMSALYQRRVLLIDDVMTTSATIHACTNALLEGGVAEVRVLTLTRRIGE